MPNKVKNLSLDEILSKRQGHIMSTSRGDAMVKAVKSPPSWDKQSRSAKFVMSSEGVDRYGDIVVQAGGDIENFLANPTALLFHNSRGWPIGSWSDIAQILSGRPKRTEGILNFMGEGLDEDADRAAVHVQAGTIRTVSIGFMPKAAEWIVDEEDNWTGIKFVEWELVECSLVPIPANPDALVKSAGGDPKMLRDFVEDVLDNWRMTPEGLMLPRAEYEKLYAVIVEKIAGDKVATPVVPVVPTVEAVPPAVVEEKKGDYPGKADDLYGMEIESVQTLIDRGLVWVTEYVGSDTKTYGGTIVAAAQADAEKVAMARGFGEKVVGMLRALTPAGERTVAPLVAKGAPAPAVTEPNTPAGKSEPETTPAPEPSPEPAPEARAAEDLPLADPVVTLLREFKERIAGILGRRAAEAEAEVIPEPEVVPPSAEEIAVARARAAAVHQRLFAKGLL